MQNKYSDQWCFVCLHPHTSAQGLRLDREGNLDVVEILVLLEDGNHDLGSVVDSQNDISDASLNWKKKQWRSPL